MNLSMELSDYQVAADLLDVPVHITSDVFGFCNPHAHIAFEEYMREQTEQENAQDALWAELNNERDLLELNEGPIGDNLQDFIVDDQEEDTTEMKPNKK